MANPENPSIILTILMMIIGAMLGANIASAADMPVMMSDTNEEPAGVSAPVLRRNLDLQEVKVSEYSSLTSAVEAIGALNRALIIDTPTTTTDATVIGPNIWVHIEPGGMIKSDYAITINGRFSASVPQQQVFSGHGCVTSNTNISIMERVYPQWFGADGADRSDDTEAIQKAVDFAIRSKSTMYLPAGTYMIKTSKGSKDNRNVYGGVQIAGGPLAMQLDKNATLSAIPNDHPYYAILNLTGAVDITISGGRLVGDRTKHTGDGEFGYGVLIRGSHHVTLHDLHIADCWGDGIFLSLSGTDRPDQINSGISLYRVTSKNNRRQGMSVLAVHGLHVDHCEFSDTNGTAPQAGIDIEPDMGIDAVRDVTIESCTFSKNAFAGITTGGSLGIRDLAIVTNYFRDNPYGINATVLNPGKIENLKISANTIILPARYSGRLLAIGLGNVTGSQITDNQIFKMGGTSASSQEFGIYMTGGIDGCIVSKNMVQGIHQGMITEKSGFRNVAIEDNRFIGLTNGFYTMRPTSGFHLVRNQFRSLRGGALDIELSSALIQQNRFTEIEGTAINIRSGSQCLIQENSFKDCALRGGNSDHIIKAANLEDSVIDGNYFDNSLTSRYAIVMLTKARKSNRISNNLAPYSSNAFIIAPGDIQHGNRGKE